MKGSHLSVSIELRGIFFAQNSFWMLCIIPTMSLLPEKYITLWHKTHPSSIINFKRRKMKGSHLSVSIELSGIFFAQNSFWMLCIIPTKSLLPEKYITLGH
jgi:hypothetical protein